MKTLTLISAIVVFTTQSVNGQTNTNQIKADKINLHVVQQHKKVATHKTLYIIGSEKKQPVYVMPTQIDASKISSNLSFNDLKNKAEELTANAKLITANALKLTADNKQMQLEIANQLQQEAYELQKQSLEISFQNSLAEFNFNKLEFYQLLKSIQQTNDIVTKCITKHNDAEYDLKLAKEIRQEAYAMPNLASLVGTMSNAEEKEYLALQKQNQAIEQLKNIVLNSITVKDNLVCLK